MSIQYEPWLIRNATAEELENATQVRERIAELEKDKRWPIPTLWLNHFRSVRDFHVHLFRNGGKYTSAMELIRRVWKRRTIGAYRPFEEI